MCQWSVQLLLSASHHELYSGWGLLRELGLMAYSTTGTREERKLPSFDVMFNGRFHCCDCDCVAQAFNFPPYC